MPRPKKSPVAPSPLGHGDVVGPMAGAPVEPDTFGAPLDPKAPATVSPMTVGGLAAHAEISELRAKVRLAEARAVSAEAQLADRSARDLADRMEAARMVTGVHPGRRPAVPVTPESEPITAALIERWENGDEMPTAAQVVGLGRVMIDHQIEIWLSWVLAHHPREREALAELLDAVQPELQTPELTDADRVTDILARPSVAYAVYQSVASGAVPLLLPGWRGNAARSVRLDIREHIRDREVCDVVRTDVAWVGRLGPEVSADLPMEEARAWCDARLQARGYREVG